MKHSKRIAIVFTHVIALSALGTMFFLSNVIARVDREVRVVKESGSASGTAAGEETEKPEMTEEPEGNAGSEEPGINAEPDMTEKPEAGLTEKDSSSANESVKTYKYKVEKAEKKDGKTEEVQENSAIMYYDDEVSEASIAVSGAKESIAVSGVGEEDGEDVSRKIGHKLASLARVFEGSPYLYGGESLPLDSGTMSICVDTSGKALYKKMQKDKSIKYGVDAPGFVRLLFAALSTEPIVRLPHSCRKQAKMGKEVELKDCQPGDVVFYGVKDDSITHCGIYLGNNQVIHASGQKGEVVVSDINYRRIVKVKRMQG